MICLLCSRQRTIDGDDDDDDDAHPCILHLCACNNSFKRYAFSERHDAWLDTNDDHHCIQLFTHELIRKCKGYPNF